MKIMQIQALGDGRVVVADDKVAVPYATVTYFDHELSLGLKDVKDKTDKFTMILHDDQQFHKLNLAKDMSKDIQSAEQDTHAAMNK